MRRLWIRLSIVADEAAPLAVPAGPDWRDGQQASAGAVRVEDGGSLAVDRVGHAGLKERDDVVEKEDVKAEG